MPPVTVCASCDLAHRRGAAPLRGRLCCARCGAPLQRPDRAPLDAAIAAALCAAVFLVLANAYPLVAMHVNGSIRETTLAGAAHGLYVQGFGTLAALVLATTIIGPVTQVACALYVLLSLRLGLDVPHRNLVIRVLTRVRSWSFIEVFMLGALVALVRLAKYSTVVPGTALWACGLLMISLSALMSLATPEQLWRWTDEYRG